MNKETILHKDTLTPEPIKRKRYEGTSDLEEIDEIRLYLNEIAEIPRLTPEDEHDLTERLDNGRTIRKDGYKRAEITLTEDAKDAYDTLVSANLGLVIPWVKRNHDRGVPFLDLVAAGNKGLMRGMTHFDHKRGYTISTYCTNWIRQAIQEEIFDRSHTITIPRKLGKQVARAFYEKEKLRQDLQREPTSMEMADHLGVSHEDYIDMMFVTREVISLNDEIGRGDDRMELGDLLSATPGVEDPTIEHDNRNLAQEYLDTLTFREREVMKMHYGFYGEPKTLSEIGQKFGISRERVRQIRNTVLERLGNQDIAQDRWHSED